MEINRHSGVNFHGVRTDASTSVLLHTTSLAQNR